MNDSDNKPMSPEKAAQIMHAANMLQWFLRIGYRLPDAMHLAVVMRN